MDSLVPFAALCVVLTVATSMVAAVPVTHGFGGPLLHKAAWGRHFSGGLRFLVFQGLAWLFWGVALASCVVATAGVVAGKGNGVALAFLSLSSCVLFSSFYLFSCSTALLGLRWFFLSQVHGSATALKLHATWFPPPLLPRFPDHNPER